MSSKAGRSKFLDAMKRHGIKTLRDDFREKLRPYPGDTFNGTAYRVLDEGGEMLPPLNRAMTTDEILERDSLYGTFEFVHRGYMGLVQESDIEINEGDTFRFEITGMEEFPRRSFHHLFRARPVSRLDSKPKSVAYIKAPVKDEGRPPQVATEPDKLQICKREGKIILGKGKYGLSGSETLRVYGDVKDMREERLTEGGKTYLVLKDDERTFNPKRGLKLGDVFSAILMNYKKVEGKQGNFEIWQFQPDYIGYVNYFNPGIYEPDAVPFGKLHPGWVYRFEVFRTKGRRGQIFYCKAFKTLLGKDAVSVDFTKEKYVNLPRRKPPEFLPGQKYKAGIDHMDEKDDGRRFGVFYDALHPDKTGLVHFESQKIAEEIRLGRWVYARVSHTEPGKRGRTTVHTDFVEFAKSSLEQN